MDCCLCGKPVEAADYTVCDVCWEAVGGYDRNEALKFMATPVKEGCRRWVCTLCGFPQGDFEKSREDIGAYCCGGCGMTCVRPLEEVSKASL